MKGETPSKTLKSPVAFFKLQRLDWLFFLRVTKTHSFLVHLIFQYASSDGVTPNYTITALTSTSIICPHKVPIVVKLSSMSLNFCLILFFACLTCMYVVRWGGRRRPLGLLCLYDHVSTAAPTHLLFKNCTCFTRGGGQGA